MAERMISNEGIGVGFEKRSHFSLQRVLSTLYNVGRARDK